MGPGFLPSVTIHPSLETKLLEIWLCLMKNDMMNLELDINMSCHLNPHGKETTT